MLLEHTFNEELLAFLEASPTPFHAVTEMSARLQNAGFNALEEGESWALEPGGRYFLRRNDSSLVAFVVGRDTLAENGWRLWGAHTDSPCLKLKPLPDLKTQGYRQWGVQVYGGALLNPWFDRDLSLAGRVHYRTQKGEHRRCLVNLKRPVAIIPSLAIHLDREANESRSVNAQKDMPPLVMLGRDDGSDTLEALLLAHLRDTGRDDAQSIEDVELSLYDTQAPAMVGWHDEFIAGARLDNLLSCFVGLQGLLTASGDTHCVLVCNDHEEVGSMSAIGAQGPMLKSVLARIAPEAESRLRALSRSLMISADNAHGVHPNYADRHDGNHGPKLNSGPVIKINANQRYASTSETNTLFKYLCREAEVPVQEFVMRSDMACGSTIGPITASELGVKTIDVGVPTFAMHSIRELAGSRDAHALARVAAAFFQERTLPEV